MSSDVILRTERLGKRFRRRWAVRALNLEVPRGEVFGFLGPNGAGKSTTIRMLLSLVKPSEGRIELFGKELYSHRKDVLSRVGGLVESADFYQYLTARKNLDMIASLGGGLTRRAIDEVLNLVGLFPRAEDKVKTYSHGMKQRLGIAQALLGNPELIILDEPTTGLDPQGIKEVRELIRRLSKERAITVFLSSHLLSEIEQTATSMAIINMGELVVQGKVGALLNTGENVVKIDARPLEEARLLISKQQYVKGIKQINNTLEVNMPLDHAGELNTMLVRAGLEVYSLIPRRSLEDYFLSITDGSTDIR
ncbi:MAG TPA: bacitracin ABC transporter ATP-binding protein [Bacteroidetes bacterium]|nr:bacitracin ABC transporter ATP-binding protein [Bacteroidota bacterium]